MRQAAKRFAHRGLSVLGVIIISAVGPAFAATATPFVPTNPTGPVPAPYPAPAPVPHPAPYPAAAPPSQPYHPPPLFQPKSVPAPAYPPYRPAPYQPPPPAMPQWAANEPLVQLASKAFPNLTRCEIDMLYVAARGMIGFCTPGLRELDRVDLKDPQNNPAQGAHWTADREVRANLIRWMFSNGDALKRLDPAGVRLRGARVSERLILSYLPIPVQLEMQYCYFPRGIDMGGARLPGLFIQNSYTGPVELGGISVEGSLVFTDDTIFPANVPTFYGTVDMNGAQIGVLNLGGTRIFAEGSNKSTALSADGMTVRGGAFIRSSFLTDGVIKMTGSSIGTDLDMTYAQFIGKYRNGLELEGGSIKANLWWVGVKLVPSTVLDLVGSTIGTVQDDPASWPAPGNLQVDGLVYGRLGCPELWIKDCVFDASSRLKWLKLQKPGHYYPQPYRQLAQILNARGDRAGARKVLIEAQNEEMRWGHLNAMQRAWGWLLWATIDYGYESSWALVWAALLVFIGGLMVRLGHEAGVMKPVEHERRIAAPLIYSLDVFLPIVDLRLQHNWWPDPTAKGTATLFGLKFTFHGSVLRAYLWFHIVAGYVLTALFIAGLSGLVRQT